MAHYLKSMESATLFETLYSDLPAAWAEFFRRQDIMDIVAKVSEQVYEECCAATDSNHMILPPIDNVFRVFRELSPDKIKVVVLGQDPYHTPADAATGIAFSLPESHTYINPSVSNIKKAAAACGYAQKAHGNLDHWVKQGVFLVNAALTVRPKAPRCHARIWSPFTARLIQYLSDLKKSNLVFMLWGRDAEQYSAHIVNKHKHFICVCSHPSGLSAYAKLGAHPSFMTSKCFTMCNEYLTLKGIETIQW